MFFSEIVEDIWEIFVTIKEILMKILGNFVAPIWKVLEFIEEV